MLFDKCFGDSTEAQLLAIACYYDGNKIKQSQMNKLTEAAQNFQHVIICNDSFKDAMKEVDESLSIVTVQTSSMCLLALMVRRYKRILRQKWNNFSQIRVRAVTS